MLGVRHLVEWEEEVFELLKDCQITEPFLQQILDLCKEKSFFSHLGYGPLIQNLDYLQSLMVILRMNGNVCNYTKKLGNIISRIDEFENQIKSPMTREERMNILGHQYLSKVPLLHEVMFLSSFSKISQSKLQNAIIDVLVKFQESESKDLVELDKEIFFSLLDAKTTKTLIDKVQRNQRNQDFFRNIVYPPLPPKRTEMSWFLSRLSLN